MEVAAAAVEVMTLAAVVATTLEVVLAVAMEAVALEVMTLAAVVILAVVGEDRKNTGVDISPPFLFTSSIYRWDLPNHRYMYSRWNAYLNFYTIFFFSIFYSPRLNPAELIERIKFREIELLLFYFLLFFCIFQMVVYMQYCN